MRKISASDPKQSLATVVDDAQRDTIIVRRDERDVAVVLSMAEFARISAQNIAEFEEYCERIAKRASDRGLNAERFSELLRDE
jgi:PHD/YefM family antitoxin component YafN of YafNO toxin-antitoxin module